MPELLLKLPTIHSRLNTEGLDSGRREVATVVKQPERRVMDVGRSQADAQGRAMALCRRHRPVPIEFEPALVALVDDPVARIELPAERITE